MAPVLDFSKLFSAIVRTHKNLLSKNTNLSVQSKEIVFFGSSGGKGNAGRLSIDS